MALIRNSIDYGFSKNAALKFGVSSAMVLNRIIWSINIHAENAAKYKAQYFEDDQWWMVDSLEAIQAHFDGLFDVRTIKRIIKKLEESGLLISRQRNLKNYDRTKSYAVNMDMWHALDSAKFAPSMRTRVSGRKQPKTQANTHSDKMSQSESDKMSQSEGDKMSLSSLSNSQSKSLTKYLPRSASASENLSDTGDTTPPTAELHTFPLNSKRAKKHSYDLEDMALAKEWLQFAIEQKGGKPYPSWTEENFAKELAKIRRTTDFNHFALREIFNFIMSDHKFWRRNALSPAGLLAFKDNGNRKIDNIFQAMKGSTLKSLDTEGATDRALRKLLAEEQKESNAYN